MASTAVSRSAAVESFQTTRFCGNLHIQSIPIFQADRVSNGSRAVWDAIFARQLLRRSYFTEGPFLHLELSLFWSELVFRFRMMFGWWRVSLSVPAMTLIGHLGVGLALIA